MKKTVFMHIPKTGGTSVFETLQSAFGKNKVVLNNSLYFGEADIVCGHVSYRPSNKNWLWVSFVRHPISRLQSFYYYVCDKPKTRAGYWEDIIRGYTLEEWLECPESKNHMVKLFAGKTFRDNLERGDLKLAKENADRFLFIGRQETFTRDMQLMLEILGAPSIQVAHTNRSTNPDTILYSGTYGNEADFDLYEYICQKQYL